MEENNEKPIPKDNKKMIHCKNCRQDILAEKMFLHEGFCNRNNIYCDHCNKVFLKEDYQSHLFNSKNEKKRMLKTPDRPRRKEKGATIKTINIYTSPIITRRSTAFEFIEMPMIEEYKVNKPIIISEDGQILSNKNKNEDLLPYFGINSAKSNDRDNLLDENIITNQDEFIENNPILFQQNDINMNQYIKETLRNSENPRNININYDTLFGKNDNIDTNINKLDSKLNIINLTENLDFLEHSKNLNRSHSSNMLFNKINLNDNNSNFLNNNNNFDNNFIATTSGSKKNNINNKQKNNNIIINNNIITYNSNNNINKIHNFFNAEENKPKYHDKSLMNNDIFQEINATRFNPTRTSSKNEILDFKKNIEKNIINNSSKKSNKEPNDRNSKINSSNNKNNKISSYKVERSPKNSSKKKTNSNNKNKNKVEKKNIKNNIMKKCEFCDSLVDDLVVHYKIYHYKMNKDLLKPQKRDTVLLNEKLNNTNTNDNGIEESNKKILLRQFKSNFHLIKKHTSNNIKNRSKNKFNFKTEKKTNSNNKKFKSPNNIQKVKKINLNKNLENLILLENSEKKSYPEDNFRASLAIRTQARDYTDKRKKIFININDNLIQSEYRSMKNRNAISPLNIKAEENNFFNNINDNSSPYYFTEARNSDKSKNWQLYRSPIVQKIDFTNENF